MNENIIQRKNHRRSSIRINEIYTFILMLSPILFMYGVGVGTVTLADAILILLNIIFIFKILIEGKISVFFNLIPFLMYIVVLSLVIKIDSDAVMRTFRYLFYLINVIFFIKKYFNFKIGVKVYRFISLVSTGFLFIQILFYKLLGIYLPGVIVGANLIASDLYDYNSVLQQAQYKRFMSFFEEPSHFAIYIVGYITILLFVEMNSGSFRKRHICELSFLSVGVALSTSILGVMVLGAMLVMWLVLNLYKGRKNFVRLILFVFAFITVLILLSQTTAFEYFTNSNIVNRQAGGRFGGYAIFNDRDSNIALKLLGRGMVSNDYGTFLASYPLLVYYFGYIGLILFVAAFIPYFINLKMNVSKALLICLFGIAFGSELLLGRFILVFLPFIITKHDKGISEFITIINKC